MIGISVGASMPNRILLWSMESTVNVMLSPIAIFSPIFRDSTSMNLSYLKSDEVDSNRAPFSPSSLTSTNEAWNLLIICSAICSQLS